MSRLRYLTAGESHGEALTVLMEGLPANLPLDLDRVNAWLAQRQMGHGRGGRQKIEQDKVRVTAGLRNGLTLGSPLVMTIDNRDWANWERVMHATHVEARYLRSAAIHRPRPGHADLPGGLKYDQQDLRNILERASARETAARTAAGAVAAELLACFGVRVAGHVVEIGGVASRGKVSFSQACAAAASPVRCADAKAGKAMVAAIDKAKAAGDSLGGAFEVRLQGLPPGLGSHVQWDRKLDARMARALMSIQAIKAVEVGLGAGFAHLPGSRVHDPIRYRQGRYQHDSNNAGGFEGGMSNGEEVVLRATMKPIPTLFKPLMTVDMQTKQRIKARYERSDTCAVPAACVVGQAVACFEAADAFLEKFGGDSLAELKRNHKAALAAMARR
jgi:chorismate synthase